MGNLVRSGFGASGEIANCNVPEKNWTYDARSSRLSTLRGSDSGDCCGAGEEGCTRGDAMPVISSNAGAVFGACEPKSPAVLMASAP